jgi:hypothetical protein
MNRALVVILIGFSFLCVYSQSESDSLIYTEGLALLNKAQTAEQYFESASYFEKVTQENPEHWLAPYYAGLSYILAARNAPAGINKDALLDKAQQFVDKSVQVNPVEPENHILQAFLYQVRLLVDPQGRALSFAQKADASLKKAISSDSSNPRAYFLMANNVYNTPPVFKGGPKNALPVFMEAKMKFRSFRPPLSFSPSWGEEQNEEMIKICRNQIT